MSLVAAALDLAPHAGRQEDDRTLAIALLRGAPGAAERAWTTFSPLVLRILRRTLGPGPDPHDFTQEVFLRLFTRIRELRDQSALRAFVVNISMGVAQNELRSRRVRQRLGLTTAGAMPERAVAGADFEARQAVARCYRLLDGLGDDDRALFVLRYVEKMDLAEVAAARAWSRSKTKRRLARVTACVARLMARDPALADYVTRRCSNTNNQPRGDER